ncbi:MAG: TlpA family protein disulfide reductase [Armatimonadetes bacterium]|nr:TlpA family protein disulfide reductase [Armatimonadota bacterium]
MSGESPHGHAGSARRILALVSVLLPIAFLIGLLGWAALRVGERRGRIPINIRGGEVPIKPRPARDVTLTLFDGRTLRLADLKGRVLMIDFWASWCPRCRAEVPLLARVYTEYRSQGVEFVGVAIWDTAEAAEAFLQEHGITYPNGLDGAGRIAIDHGVTGIPEKYFVDRRGMIRRKLIGPVSEEVLRRMLDDLLAAQ